MHWACHAEAKQSSPPYLQPHAVDYLSSALEWDLIAMSCRVRLGAGIGKWNWEVGLGGEYWEVGLGAVDWDVGSGSQVLRKISTEILSQCCSEATEYHHVF